MAIDTGFYSLKEWQVAIKPDDPIGTDADTNGMTYVNIEDYPSVDFNVDRHLDTRHGAGRVAKKADVFVEQFGKDKLISWTGIYDQTIAPMLISNAFDIEVSISPASFDLPYNFTGNEYKHSDASKGNLGAFYIALISPEGSNTILIHGCMVERLKIYASVGENGGRLMYDVELKSRYNFSFENAAPTTPSAYASTYRAIYDLATKQQIDGMDVDMYKFEIEIISNNKFAGFGADGIPSTMRRGIPDIEVNGIFGIKYDANSDQIIAKQVTENDIVVEISNNASFPSATFGFMGSFAQINGDVDVTNVEDGAFLDVPFKFMADTSGDVIQIVP